MSYTGVSKYVQPEKEKHPSAAENLTQVEASMRKELRQHVGRGALLFCLHQMALLYIGHFSHLSILEWCQPLCHLNCLCWSMTSWMKVIMSHHCESLDFNKYTQLYSCTEEMCANVFVHQLSLHLFIFNTYSISYEKAYECQTQPKSNTNNNWGISNQSTWQNRNLFWQVRITTCTHYTWFLHIFAMIQLCFFLPDQCIWETTPSCSANSLQSPPKPYCLRHWKTETIFGNVIAGSCRGKIHQK